MLAEIQTSRSWSARTDAFAAALMDAEALTPDGIGKAGAPAPKRFSVYRNNVIVSLMEALKSAFPSIYALLGEATFNRLARAFVARNPPTSPMMQRYGGAFPEFLENLPALSELPFLSDVARLELAWVAAYHAADTTPLAPDDIGALSPDQLMAQVLTASPATQLVASEHSVIDLFNARHAWPTGQTDFRPRQTALVTRQGYGVHVMGLQRPVSVFFSALISGATLGVALGEAMEADSQFDPSSAIAAMLESQAFRSFNQK